VDNKRCTCQKQRHELVVQVCQGRESAKDVRASGAHDAWIPCLCTPCQCFELSKPSQPTISEGYQAYPPEKYSGWYGIVPSTLHTLPPRPRRARLNDDPIMRLFINRLGQGQQIRSKLYVTSPTNILIHGSLCRRSPAFRPRRHTIRRGCGGKY
jgi:hypothetical protein